MTRPLPWSERLGGLDASFLYVEDRTTPMHVGAVTVFEGTPPGREDLLAHVRARLADAPRWRQRLRFVPLSLGRPVWVDDPGFDLERHVRSVALGPPGGEAALRAVVAERFGARLDRSRPLWEMLLVTGVAPRRFALVVKVHHCMLDGVAGVRLAGVLLDSSPRPSPRAEPAPWVPRPSPGPVALAAHAVEDALLDPLRAALGAAHPSSRGRGPLLEIAAGVRPLLGLALLPPAADSSLNGPLGSRRTWDTATLDLATAIQVRKAFGATLNDVLLAVVAGGLRTLLQRRGALRGGLRALVPVSLRRAEARSLLGNRVTAVLCSLPVDDPDPERRLRAVMAETRRLKACGQALGVHAWTRLGDYVAPPLLASVARYTLRRRPVNLAVTSVPGPQHPLYLLGRRLVAFHPMVPLAPELGLGVALLSYDGAVGIGLLGDAERAPDLPVLARALPDALSELALLAPRAVRPR